MCGYLRAHAKLETYRLVRAMDAQRLAVNAEPDAYTDAREALLTPDDETAARRQAQHLEAVQQVFGLPDNFWSPT